MRRKYKNPPVVEALVELHFTESRPDPTVGGRFSEAWKDRVTSRDVMQQIQVTMGPLLKPPAPPPPSPTDRLWFEAPKGAVQVGPGFLSVHLLEQPYPGQEVFRPLLENALAVYRELQAPTGIARAAMQYINRLLVPVDAEDGPANWLDPLLAPDPPASMEERIASVAVQWVSFLPSGRGVAIYALRSGARNETQEFMLDISAHTTGPIELDTLNSWLDDAHEVIVSAFEDSITDEARAAFGEFDAAQA